MKNKEEYIKERVERFQRHIDSVVTNMEKSITDMKNLSDDEYRKIVGFSEEKEKYQKNVEQKQEEIVVQVEDEDEDDDYDEEEAALVKLLDQVGISLEDYDNMSIEDLEKFKVNITPELEAEYLDFLNKY